MDPKYNDSIVWFKYKRANHDTMEYFFTADGTGDFNSTAINNPSYLNYTHTKKAEGSYQIQMVKNFGILSTDLKQNNTTYLTTVISQLDSQKVKYCAIQSSQFVPTLFNAGDDTTLFEPVTQIGEMFFTTYDDGTGQDFTGKLQKITWQYFTVKASDILPVRIAFGNTFKIVISDYVGKHEVYSV